MTEQERAEWDKIMAARAEADKDPRYCALGPNKLPLGDPDLRETDAEIDQSISNFVRNSRT